MNVFIEDETGMLSDKLEQVISTVAEKVLANEGFTGDSEISVVVVDNHEIRLLNKQHRGIDMATDVLSFPMEDEEILGDIAVSLERATEQAQEYGHSLEREIGFLTAHGMLHLLGYDHLNKDEEHIMIEKQKSALDALNLKR